MMIDYNNDNNYYTNIDIKVNIYQRYYKKLIFNHKRIKVRNKNKNTNVIHKIIIINVIQSM
jgi:hypothetical protein